jgi:hypothetical protein
MSTRDAASPTFPAAAPRPSWLRRSARRAGIALAVFAALIVVLVTVVRMATAGPERAVHHFLAAADSGDYAAAYDDFSAPLKSMQTLDDFTSAMRANAALVHVKETTFNNRSVDTDGAELSGSVTLESGTTVPASFRLVRENGTWKLLGYHIGS